MSDARRARRTLAVPSQPPTKFVNNFIQQAVCEIRFPTLYEFDGKKPPLAFANAIKREFPNYQSVDSVKLSVSGVAQSRGHTFKSRNGNAGVTLKESSLSIEVSSYDSFEEFEKRIRLVLGAAKDLIDSDFVTRLGLRYINTIPVELEDIESWINSSLVGDLSTNVYGDISELAHRVRGFTPQGGYLLQHGIGEGPEGSKVHYVLDFDFFAEDVDYPNVIETVRALHAQEFSFFMWTLGRAAKDHLSGVHMGENHG